MAGDESVGSEGRCVSGHPPISASAAEKKPRSQKADAQEVALPSLPRLSLFSPISPPPLSSLVPLNTRCPPCRCRPPSSRACPGCSRISPFPTPPPTSSPSSTAFEISTPPPPTRLHHPPSQRRPLIPIRATRSTRAIRLKRMTPTRSPPRATTPLSARGPRTGSSSSFEGGRPGSRRSMAPTTTRRSAAS